jgi:hypothetical protein
MRIRLALVLLAAAASGCNKKLHAVPSMNPTPALADYTVLGKTNHEECGTYIFAIDWGHLFSNQKTSVRARATSLLGMLPFVGPTPEESRALYHALDKMPEATHLLANRAHVTATGFTFGMEPIFGERCAFVEAHGVKIGERPFPGGTGVAL